MAQTKAVKKVVSTNKQQNLTQNNSTDGKKKNECGCGCIINQKK